MTPCSATLRTHCPDGEAVVFPRSWGVGRRWRWGGATGARGQAVWGQSRVWSPCRCSWSLLGCGLPGAGPSLRSGSGRPQGRRAGQCPVSSLVNCLSRAPCREGDEARGQGAGPHSAAGSGRAQLARWLHFYLLAGGWRWGGGAGLWRAVSALYCLWSWSSPPLGGLAGDGEPGREAPASSHLHASGSQRSAPLRFRVP